MFSFNNIWGRASHQGEVIVITASPGWKWITDCFQDKKQKALAGLRCVLMRLLSLWWCAGELNLTFERRWREKKESDCHAFVPTFMRCWFIHFVNVFFCTLSLSSEEEKRKKHGTRWIKIITSVWTTRSVFFGEMCHRMCPILLLAAASAFKATLHQR